jgi:hypothetical protein
MPALSTASKRKTCLSAVGRLRCSVITAVLMLKASID